MLLKHRRQSLHIDNNVGIRCVFVCLCVSVGAHKLTTLSSAV